MTICLSVLRTVCMQGREKEADQRRCVLSEGSKSDHIMLANAFQVGYSFSLLLIVIKPVTHLFHNVFYLPAALKKHFLHIW